MSLVQDVEERGLSIALFADWYNVDVMRKIKFFDENSKQWWTPATGYLSPHHHRVPPINAFGALNDCRGANVPAINDLLASWRIQFGERIFDGEINMAGNKATVGQLTKSKQVMNLTE